MRDDRPDRSPETLVVLTKAQRAILASHRSYPDAGHQNPAIVIRFAPGTEADGLRRAFDQVVLKCDILRLRVRSTDEAIIDPGIPSATRMTESPAAEFIDICRQRATEPLDLAEACYESVICTHPDGAVTWYMNLHHIINDGSSAGLVLDAVEQEYRGQGIPPQHYFEEIDETPAQAAQAHWQARTPPPAIDRLYAHLTRADAAAAHAEVTLDPDLAALWAAGFDGPYRLLLPDISRTAFLMAATAEYLYRLTGQADLCLGTVVNTRRPQAKHLIGPAFDLFPVDISVAPTDSFKMLFDRAAEALFRTLRHAKPGTAPKQSFDALINVLPASVTRHSFDDRPCRMSWLTSGAIDGSHAIRVMSTPYARLSDDPRAAGDLPNILLDITRTALGPVTVGQARDHFHGIVRATLSAPDAPLADRSLATEAEQALLAAHTTGPVPTGPVLPVAERLRNILEGQTQTVLRQSDQSLSGDELWLWALAVSENLEKTTPPKARIGIGLRPSAEAVAAIYGAVLSGRSFVPIDMIQPEDRIAALRARAGIAVMFDTPETIRALKPGQGTRSGPTLPTVSPEDEAYLLFTSGSTGEPKGVPITHGGLSAYLHHATERYFTDPTRPVAPLFGALNFDLTLTTLFGVPLAGGELIACPEPAAQAIQTFAAMPEVTWAKATPSQLKVLTGLPDVACALRTLIVGGEAFTGQLARRIDRTFPGITMINEYGPTEAVVGCMEHIVTQTDLDRGQDISIGRPIAGVTLRVMDPFGQPVPPGAIGELWIHHDGIMAGYLGGSPDPFGDYDGKRHYRSGDLVRQAKDGSYDYLGRADAQLKLNGIRYDPSEIETAALSHPGVDKAVAMLWSPRARKARRYCVTCGLPDTVPGVTYSETGECASCRAYAEVREAADQWFGTPEDLAATLASARERQGWHYDCMHLLSGGKDSTFALYQLVALGAKPFVVTLDNGYISDEAKANIDAVVADLNLPHEYLRSDNMTAIFRESLDRYSNVCNGCYKLLYVKATARADALGIPVIVTGLSRGQLFETRLIPEQFQADRFDPDGIDKAVLAARRAYHHMRDTCSQEPDAQVFGGGEVFDRIAYVDFYRYFDVPLAEMLRFLDEQTPWTRPSDTGRSTNCLINNTGIFTHLEEQGYHNYAIPYAWDVRLGHKTRDEAIAELEDDLDLGSIHQILDEVGYSIAPQRMLALWYSGPGAPDGIGMQEHLSSRLPRYAMPQGFRRIDDIPLTANGKIDADALPQPARALRPRTDFSLAEADPLEATIIAEWEEVLNMAPITRQDDFFLLGGDSLAALSMIISLGRKLDLPLGDGLAFTERTPVTLARAIRRIQAQQGDRPAPTIEDFRSHLWTPEDPPPLTAGETSLLYEQKQDPASTKLNVGRLFRIPVALDPDRLQAAAARAASAHVPLTWSYSLPRKPLDPDNLLDFSVLSDVVDPDEVKQRMKDACDQPFDLETGPLLRIRLQRTREGCVVLLAMHHVCCDHDSFTALWSQIMEVYHTGPDAPLKRYDYPGFVASLTDGREAEARQYWRDRHFETPGQLRPMYTAANTARTPLISRPLPMSSEALKRGAATPLAARALVAATCAITPYVTGGPATTALLSSPRTRAGAEGLVGYLLNPQPWQIDVTGEGSASDVLARTTQEISDVLALPNLHYAQILADRADAGLPLPHAHVMVSIADSSSVVTGDEVTQHEHVVTDNAITDATLFVETGDDGAQVTLEYSRALYSDAAAQDILDRFHDALVLFQKIQTRPVKQLLPAPAPVLDGDPAPDGPLLPQLIHDHLSTGDTSPAVICGGKTVTWAELALRVAALTQAMQAQGIGAGDKVAIALPRGASYIAAIIAVHSLRAAYVPVDLGNSPDRIRHMLEASDPALLLRTGATRWSGESLTVTDTGIGGTPWPATADLQKPQVQPGDMAYVIFTSGTTGRPKGVAITQGQLAASTHARQAVYDTVPDRFAMLSSPAFDSSVVGIFWTLATGGTVVLPTEDEAHDPDALARLLAAPGVTHSLLVPTLYAALLDRKAALSLTDWPDHVILAGEGIARSLLSRHFAAEPATRLTNEYGPTEATVWSLVRHLTAEDTTVPAGRPVPGTWAAILGEDGRPAPQGTIGELVVGGPLVAHGYLTAPAADQARFTDGAAFGRPGDRLYHTGDQAVALTGEVHVMGRTDDQLSIGGLRVEPSEIETALIAIPGVTEAIVTASDLRDLATLMQGVAPADLQRAFAAAADSDDPEVALKSHLASAVPAPPTLVAHIRARAEVTDQNLRDAMRQALPPPLRPAQYWRHAAFPVTPNGKVDRRALAAFRVPTQPAPQPTAVPANGTGDPAMLRRVTELFAKELKNAGFGPDDNFFDFGGHSLTALQLLLVLEQEFSVSLSTSALYSAPTPREFLSNLPGGMETAAPTTPAAASRQGKSYGLVFPLRKEGTRPPIIALHNLGVNGDTFTPLLETLGPDQPFWCIGESQYLDMHGKWVSDPNAPTDVKDIAAGYVEELEKLFPSGPYILAGHCLGAVFAYEVAQQMTARGRPPALLYMQEDLHAPELLEETTGELGFELHQKIGRVRKLGPREVLRLARKSPQLAVKWGRKAYLAAERRVEKVAVASAKRTGRTLSHRLAVRDFLERSYLSVKAYEYQPYDRPVAIVRRKAFQIYPQPEQGNGWGNRLTDPDILWLEDDGGAVDLIAVGHKRGRFLRAKIDAILTDSAPVPIASPPRDTRKFVRDTGRYRTDLNLMDPAFIATPRPDQARWLVDERLRELTRELEHLDRVAPEMIHGGIPAEIDDRDSIALEPDEIMEDWQIPLMREMARISAGLQGDVLEIGYGRGIASRMIQDHAPRSHTIIECNPTIIADAEDWAASLPDRDIRIVPGYWQDTVDALGPFDGILFHTYPLSSEELAEILATYSTFAENFFPVARKLLRPGGRFTYFTNDADSLSRAHQRALLTQFSAFRIGQIRDLDIPETSPDAHWFQQIVTVEAIA